MGRRFLLLLILYISLLPLWAEELSAQGSTKLFYRGLICKEDLKASIEFLTGKECGGRASGTTGAELARELIHNRFRHNGLVPLNGRYTQSFMIDSTTVGHNVVGVIRSQRVNAKYVIIGAHYDHLGVLDGKFYPGADANASGTASLIALAKSLGNMYRGGIKPQHHILFVAFDAKERNMAGSQYMAANLPVPPSQVLCVINIDQVGTTLTPPKGAGFNYLLILGREHISADLASAITYANYSTQKPLHLDYSFYGSQTFLKTFYRLSDHYAFHKRGIPAIMLTSGINDNNYKVTDTEKFIAYNALICRTQLVFEILWRIAY